MYAQKGVIKVPEIYERIEELCRKRSVNITQLCRECGIPRATLTDFKMGRIKTLSASVLSKIAEYFSVSVDYIYGGRSSSPADETELKAALFGGETEVTDEMWTEVKRYAQYVKERENGNN